MQVETVIIIFNIQADLSIVQADLSYVLADQVISRLTILLMIL